jgi:hypothetical protein
MDTTPEKKKRKRASQGLRKHTRRLKQEARKASVPENILNKRTRPA